MSRQLDIVQLSRKCAFRGALSIFVAWASLAVLFLLALRFPYLWPVSVLLAANRLRAFSLLVHEASHYNIMGARRWADRFANVFVAFPMLTTVRAYRRDHLAHHRFLGDVSKDPKAGHLDHVGVYRIGVRDLSRSDLFFSLNYWKYSLFGDVGTFKDLTGKEKAGCLLWWSLLIFMLGVFAGFFVSLSFVLFWFGTRATSYHFLRATVDYLDHSGLSGFDTYSKTRVYPEGPSVWSAFFQPMGDRYHLIHHLRPGIPYYNLRQAHSELLRIDGAYALKYEENRPHDASVLWGVAP